MQVDVDLPCGHTIQGVECHTAQNVSVLVCREKVDVQLESCGHLVKMTCSDSRKVLPKQTCLELNWECDWEAEQLVL